jgi:tetratricopeptide (TPR) repeat protein
VTAMPPRISRIGLLVLAAAVFVAGLPRCASAGQAKVQNHASSGESRSEWFLVFPFENESRVASLDWLGEGLSELTAERLQDKHVSVLTRQDRLATLEKMGLPDSARFSHATLVKIATEADADALVYGRFQSDGKTATIEARVLHLTPPSLSPAFSVTGSVQDLLRLHARLAWQILCAIDRTGCPPEGANRDESSFSEPPPSLRPDALENFVRGLISSENDVRLRLLREAARLEPNWDRPAFELGQIYYDRRDCDSTLVWLSRVPPNRPDGALASFDAGVCHLLRNDPQRAEAAFSGLLDRARGGGQDSLSELPEVHNNLGIARLRQGKWAEASTEFERATALDEEEADYWFNLGVAKLVGKQAPSAAAPLERATKIDPDDKDMRALLIATLESVGRKSDAAEMRNVAGETAKPTPVLNIKDVAAVARMARISRNVDRALLRPAAEVAGQPSQKPEDEGAAK